MTSLNPEDLAEEDESTSVIDFPVRSALLLLSTMKDEIREPSQCVLCRLQARILEASTSKSLR